MSATSLDDLSKRDPDEEVQPKNELFSHSEWCSAWLLEVRNRGAPFLNPGMTAMQSALATRSTAKELEPKLLLGQIRVRRSPC